ncbi:DUF1559 family PulG-like putative transporter [Paludisphaera rhizosphaerae]|uniref:DUF1559 family PulG-like putative transporter n=1 Tax=Paludisphaera rhizosphaerae TaxID=2711216 RepID=UPI0013EA9A92|nr:DUF1559 domain-containing protein [Paludisphaera rhizosphaerae]
MSILPADDPEFRDLAKKPGEIWAGRVVKISMAGFALLFTAALALLLLAAILLPTIRSAEPIRRAQCAGNLRQIMVALQSYANDYGALPPACSVDAQGQILHSWRTLILPYLGEEDLYRSIDLSKSWKDPANQKARESAVAVYQCPVHGVGEGWTTSYLACVGPHAFLLPTEPRPLATITDPPDSTLAVIECMPHESVRHLELPWTWMAPDDAKEGIVIGLGPNTKARRRGTLNAAFVDGNVRSLKAPIEPSFHTALRSVDGGETIKPEEW